MLCPRIQSGVAHNAHMKASKALQSPLRRVELLAAVTRYAIIGSIVVQDQAVGRDPGYAFFVFQVS